MRVVVALGGNALLRRDEGLTALNQRRNVARAAKALAPIAEQHTLVISHGNGPQVGLLALQAHAYAPAEPYPLDVLGAESEGMIGYMIEQELGSLLPERPLATVLTMVEVDPDDPAFSKPTKPIGPGYGEEEAERMRRERGWAIARDGDRWRRVVASPAPHCIHEIQAVRWLLDHGVTVICAGGGGIPTIRRDDGRLEGVEAVIDKDRASALLAREIDADALILATDVDAVHERWGTPGASPIGRVTASALSAGSYDPGTMGPKVEAACRFVDYGAEEKERRAAIGALEDVPEMLAGSAGTQVTRS